MRQTRVTDRNSPLFDEMDFQRSCKQKQTYTTPFHAQFAIDFCEDYNGRVKLRYYKCPYCLNYHLTEIV